VAFVGGLVPESVRVIEPVHFDEQKRFHFLELIRVARIVGQVSLLSGGRVSDVGDDLWLVVLLNELVEIGSPRNNDAGSQSKSSCGGHCRRESAQPFRTSVDETDARFV
jgi:hypothetical protein